MTTSSIPIKAVETALKIEQSNVEKTLRIYTKLHSQEKLPTQEESLQSQANYLLALGAMTTLDKLLKLNKYVTKGNQCQN